MPGFKEYDIKIADYFDNKMSAAEEDSFMEALGTNTPLRERYEDELSIRAILGNGIENEDIAVEDNVVYMNTSTPHAPHKIPVIPLYRQYKIIAAVFILVIGISALFMVFKNQRNNTNSAAITPVSRDSVKKIDTSQNVIPQNTGVSAANAFAQYYKPYISNNDPVEVSIYYEDYKQGRYADVFAASDADLQVMGANDNKQQLGQYLQLYKGLAYLAENKPAKAQLQLDSVMHAANKTTTEYYEAQWYSCMAFLKQEDAGKAGLLAKTIAQSASSPYKVKAAELVTTLRVK